MDLANCTLSTLPVYSLKSDHVGYTTQGWWSADNPMKLEGDSFWAKENMSSLSKKADELQRHLKTKKNTRHLFYYLMAASRFWSGSRAIAMTTWWGSRWNDSGLHHWMATRNTASMSFENLFSTLNSTHLNLTYAFYGPLQVKLVFNPISFAIHIPNHSRPYQFVSKQWFDWAFCSPTPHGPPDGIFGVISKPLPTDL
ncbi:hypothetical protein DSO57_1013565 [Entomophthora muscae]|uniref:Uncharacterized protein n=1 Tax=Entomophthora muscae TaxID=34485 RepID=A0ACC2RKI4_9FUNG|nr:hypothetical protein DSO57_1013565 [Entomophthora muscae]